MAIVLDLHFGGHGSSPDAPRTAGQTESSRPVQAGARPARRAGARSPALAPGARVANAPLRVPSAFQSWEWWQGTTKMHRGSAERGECPVSGSLVAESGESPARSTAQVVGRADPSGLRQLLTGLTAVRDGDFGTRLPKDGEGLL